MIEWKPLRKDDLSTLIESWTSIEHISSNISQEHERYRKRLNELNQNVKAQLGIETSKGKEYQYDLRFGLGLYSILNQEFQITENQASNDHFWIYLGTQIIPEIVFVRWGVGAHDRFYANSRRIWLKALWWYIHLSWQGDVVATAKILSGNTTDEVVQLVERSGPFGYRVNLCRVLMRTYGEYGTEDKGRRTNLFRRAMKLNTARLAVVEPALYEGEEEGYAKDLFNELIAN